MIFSVANLIKKSYFLLNKPFTWFENLIQNANAIPKTPVIQ